MSKEHLNPEIQNISDEQLLPDDQIMDNQILPDDLCVPENEIPILNELFPDTTDETNNENQMDVPELMEVPTSIFQDLMANPNDEQVNPIEKEENENAEDIVHLDITNNATDSPTNQENNNDVQNSDDEKLSNEIDLASSALLPQTISMPKNESPANTNDHPVTEEEEQTDNKENKEKLASIVASNSAALIPPSSQSSTPEKKIAKSNSNEPSQMNWVPKDDVQEQQDLHKKIDRLMSPDRKRTGSRSNHKRKEIRSPLFVTDETQPIDMPPDMPNIEINENEKSLDLATAPNELENGNVPEIQVDIDEANDVVQLYSYGDEKKQIKPRQTPKTQQRTVRTSYQSRTPSRPPRFSSDISLNDLPPLQTSPEMDSKLAELLRNFEKKGKIPEPEMRPKLIQYMQREKVNALVRHKYNDAQRYQTLTTKFMNSISQKAHDEEYSEKMSSVEEKVGETDVRLKQLRKETQDLIRDEKEHQTQRRLSLKINHKEELQAFEAKWNDMDYLQTFAKPSPYLFQLQKIERSMILTKMYSKAEETRKKITQTEKEESKLAQERALEEMEKQQRKILIRQQQEMEAFEKHCQRNIEIIKRNQELKMESILSRRSTLEKEKVMIKEGQKNVLPTIVAIQNPNDGSIEQTMTPRTAHRYAAFKAQNKGPSLTIKPLGKLISKRRNRLIQSAPATDL